MPFLEFLILLVKASFWKTIKSYNSVIKIFKFYVYKSRESKFINISNLIAKLKEQKNALNNFKEKNCFYNEMTPNKQHNFNNLNGLCSRDFDEESNKLYVENNSQKF